VSRIALIPSAYPPAVGGVEELTRHLALSLTRAGDAVEVWTPKAVARGRPVVEQLDGLTVRRFAFPLPGSQPRQAVTAMAAGSRTLAALWQASRQFRPDVLHVQCFGPNGIYATALAAMTRTPLVVTLQGETVMDDNDVFEHSPVLRTGLRRALRQAAAVTGCSAFTVDDAVKRFGLAPGRGVSIFNGVEVAGAANLEQAPLEPVAPGRYVLALGRVVEKKGFDLLLAAFGRVADRHPDVDLVIGGDGAALGGLREAASTAGLAKRVHFPGRLSREAVAGAMAGADIFVMPSRLEPFGIVVLEAWRAGAPVIATSRGGPPEFVRDGIDGFLADPFDTEALAARIDALLADGDLRGSMAAAGSARVAEFAWPVLADRYRAIYQQVG
jgi:glycosyltransferase involved in cell wall biosynthesis